MFLTTLEHQEDNQIYIYLIKADILLLKPFIEIFK